MILQNIIKNITGRFDKCFFNLIEQVFLKFEKLISILGCLFTLKIVSLNLENFVLFEIKIEEQL